MPPGLRATPVRTVESLSGEAEDALLAGKVMFPSPEVFADG